MSLCLTAGASVVALALSGFSLSWTHSVERIEWREEWRLTDRGLAVEAASVKGSGAGMELPDGAVLRDGAWHYRPVLPAQKNVSFADAGRKGDDWTFCARGLCRHVRDIVPSEGRGFTLGVCERPGLDWADVAARPR